MRHFSNGCSLYLSLQTLVRIGLSNLRITQAVWHDCSLSLNNINRVKTKKAFGMLACLEKFSV